MRKSEKPNGRPSLHTEKVTHDEPQMSAPRAAAAAPLPASPAKPRIEDAEVPAVPRRRSFTAEFKREVLAEVDAAEPGEIGAILRRRGLYSSHLTEWRRQRDEGALTGLAPRQRGRKAQAKNPLRDEVARLEHELARVTARAKRAEGLVALQKKVAELLGEELPSEEELFDAERRGLPIPPPRRRL
jgi:transposase